MKQQYLLRTPNIRANAINAINQLQLDEKRPVVIEIKEMIRSICKYPGKTNHSLLEIFRHTDYVP
ncbi:recombination protein NinB [Kluyvera intermedia]|uniref:recombination protein NinB n=1 Tax=Kluyvera intermedia TaxID=61648 RepID=UPI00372D0E6C